MSGCVNQSTKVGVPDHTHKLETPRPDQADEALEAFWIAGGQGVQGGTECNIGCNLMDFGLWNPYKGRFQVRQTS